MKDGKEIVVEVGSPGSGECYTLMAKMLYFVADPMIGKDRLVVQKECGGVDGTGSTKDEVSWVEKKSG